MTDDWRSAKKAQTRRSIQDHALRLFVTKGYDETTVEEIAAAAGVSHMTFFRHFPRKEEVVEYDEYDPMMADLIVARPPEESPLEAVAAAMRAGLEMVLPTDRDTILIRSRLLLSTPALQARNWIAQEATRDLIADALARRAEAPGPDLVTNAQAAAIVAAAGAAITAWAAEGGTRDLVAAIDEALGALASMTSVGARPAGSSR
ncbi:TetR/AcrR family transcriptional regulator [Mycobacterium sp. CVI_P3]|uniref:TetR/AcrR family transcriptional regulator n=1 Tax=Mycobacterium pinniadriaticum TaxID=2994102 RepID=A0ABT3SII9_9MYCO|nr:TetR/AcrR family transcriptional regulator [Mycobacterium pinniadriaticum]MCX2932238.1 TetR/AcrR family transcriptional regulator [Mycobacterium pinniadriaticum]MCX2938662.1 TetR/AcrR family transcriptional regulator [Mycobacterium pinniadriaticum]